MVRTCFAASVAALLILAPAAQAVDIRVVNERGIAQYGAFYTDDGSAPSSHQSLPVSDVDGWIKDVEPGTTLRVTRSPSANPCGKNPGGAPEGPDGVTFGPVTEAGGTITLPNATGPSYQPDSNEAERWIAGKINELRGQRGAPPMRVSTVLNRVAGAVARKQAVESLSFPPPFCPIVVLDWGFPAMGYASVDANGTDPRKAWAHWSDGSVREKAVTHPDFNAVGVGDGSGAWAVYLAKCPADREARCELTADQGDPNIQLPPSTQAPPAGEGPGALPPVMGAVTFAARQRGRAVKGSVEVGRAGSAVAVRLKRGTKIVGKLLEQDVAAGKLSLRIALNHSGKKLLKAKRKLALKVEVVVDPPTGDSATVTRSVKLRR